MRSPKETSRREFVKIAGIAVGASGIAAGANAKPSAKLDGESALVKLIEGNERFVKGQTSLLSRRRPEDYKPLAEGQAPMAVIVGCADSRVPPELIFDQGVGDLFVIRVAGNIVGGAGPTVKGSIEYAIAELGTRLIMVLGHSQCGAVKAAIQHIEANDALPGAIGDLIDPIRPAARSVTGQGADKLENVIRANVANGVARLKGLDPILSKLVKNDELKIVGATYELSTGKVQILT
jgi:carbonic anhydrase